jgi:DNA repair exonuclease SbcCD ATPase subunit
VPGGSGQALREHRQAMSGQKKEAVGQALPALAGRGATITNSLVAREAGVSREFIHHHPELHTAVKEAAHKVRKAWNLDQVTGAAASARGATADRLTLVAEIQRLRVRAKEQKKTIDELRAQRRRWLGAQFLDSGRVDAAVHAELRSANERLMTEKAGLTNTINDLRRTITALEHDLAAVREALAQELAEPKETSLTLTARNQKD